MIVIQVHILVYRNLSFCIVQVQKRLFEEGFMVDVDLAPGDSFNKKIRNAQLAQYNYILGMLGALPGL